MNFKKRPFLSEEEFDHLMHAGGKRPYEVFNEVLDRVYTRALESALLAFPETAISLVRHASSMNNLRKEFFDKNPDVVKNLPAFKEALAHLEEKEPATQYDELLNKAASLMRQGQPVEAYKLPASLPEPSMGKLGSPEDMSLDEAFGEVFKDE